ncbi:flagellar protein FlaG [Dendrosporobacter sp. 1207_IL3150]|uniref:flagellar protein FlaG n=1 Tax=Dendrosporobacter sp. 1207_IL3150 TaxID=3084054 RepID=UPI002FD95E13
MAINTNLTLTPAALPNNKNSSKTENFQLTDVVGNLEYKTDKQSKNLNNEEVVKITDEMNKFMELINSDIQFEVHEKTNRLIVKVVDQRDGKVLKEFPPHELLDTMAKISEYVGILLDKKV